MAQHHPTGSETTLLYAPRSSRFGSELPSVEDDVGVWRYAILELHARNDNERPGCPRITWMSTVHQDLRHHNLTVPEQWIWLRTASVEDDVDV